jgi:hypothetical protein
MLLVRHGRTTHRAALATNRVTDRRTPMAAIIQLDGINGFTVVDIAVDGSGDGEYPSSPWQQLLLQ